MNMTMKSLYLTLYNALSAALWARILVSTLTTSPSSLYPYIEPWARDTQSLAIVEILHAALGITRAPVFTTFTQVFTRCVQVWAIDRGYPQLFSPSPASGVGVGQSEPGLGATIYAAMLFAWSLADVVRYSYFVILLAESVTVPGWLKWLRYSLFFVLYPIGIGGEWFLMYNAARVADTTPSLIYYFCLGLYVPGAIMMYSYMVKQRRKTLYGRGR
ncbi:putative membrane protein [Aspergillus chevalieri]|uniref:Very-long-chain (3R)-3-hydroxyacyl-CoA dehydratase n=1 Tax=Aspergillus chevalieri TaxID=182096 RepID=A0A7R7ZLD0_ASPCH|nr:uncharacterized protein ACHE_20933S [Aspergillus chevalieri]BCR85474.1 hypothetical protein ACHE_20933S [Aspergillus chevalieri]